MMEEKSYFLGGKNYTKTEIQKLFEQMFAQYKKNPDQRLEITLKMLEGKEILDVGCHSGVLAKQMAQMGFTVYGIDVLTEAIEIAREFNSITGTSYEVRDLLKNPFPENSFDCITFLETIEHVENPALYLREFYRILKPSGCLVLSTPNATSFKNLLYALSYRKKNKRREIARDISLEPRNVGTQLEHIYNWDYPTLMRLLDRCGFQYMDHAFARSGPIVLPLFGKKVKLLGTNSNIFSRLNLMPFMTTHVIKVRKRLVG